MKAYWKQRGNPQGVLFYLLLNICICVSTFIISCRTNEPDDTSVIVSMEREPCLGFCPWYAVSASAGGTVTWMGKRYVKEKDTLSVHIDPAIVQRIVQEFDRVKFDAIADRFAAGVPCGPVATDLPGLNLSLKRFGVTKSVNYYYGCTEYPDSLTKPLIHLGTFIDSVLQTGKWVSATD